MRMRTQRDVKNLFLDHGYQIVSIHRTAHWIVKASINGYVKSFTVSVSPSDCRGHKNLIALLRRTAKETTYDPQKAYDPKHPSITYSGSGSY